MLTYFVETREFLRLRRATLKLLGDGTARAVRVALDEAADYARRNHSHRRRTGDATDPRNLYGELRQVLPDGAWGYLTNRSGHALYLEEGTKRHLILPLDYHWGSRRAQRPTSRVTGRRTSAAAGAGRGMALRFQIGGQDVFRRKVMHPGTQPRPFMAPASRFAGEVIERETERVTFRLCASLWE